jgi:hypothetical protein
MSPLWMILFGPLALCGASAAWLALRQADPPADRAVLLCGGFGLVVAPLAAWSLGSFDSFVFGYLAAPFGIAAVFLWRAVAAKASKATSRFYNVAGLSILTLTGLPLLAIFAIVAVLGGRVGH